MPGNLFQEHPLTGYQDGYNCFDIAAGFSREDFLAYALEHSGNLEFRAALAEEIKSALTITVQTLLNLEARYDEIEDIKNSIENADGDYLIELQTQLTNIQDWPREAFPKSMLNSEFKDEIVLRYVIYYQYEAELQVLISQYCDAQGLDQNNKTIEAVLDHANGDDDLTNAADYVKIMSKHQLFQEADQKLMDLCQSEQLYRSYIENDYGAENGWFSHQREYGSSAVKIAATMLNARINIYEKKPNGNYKYITSMESLGQANRQINVCYHFTSKHFISLRPFPPERYAPIFSSRMFKAASKDRLALDRLLSYLYQDKFQNLDLEGEHGETAVHWACEHLNVELLKALISRKANLDIIDNNQRSSSLKRVFLSFNDNPIKAYQCVRLLIRNRASGHTLSPEERQAFLPIKDAYQQAKQHFRAQQKAEGSHQVHNHQSPSPELRSPRQLAKRHQPIDTVFDSAESKRGWFYDLTIDFRLSPGGQVFPIPYKLIHAQLYRYELEYRKARQSFHDQALLETRLSNLNTSNTMDSATREKQVDNEVISLIQSIYKRTSPSQKFLGLREQVTILLRACINTQNLPTNAERNSANYSLSLLIKKKNISYLEQKQRFSQSNLNWIIQLVKAGKLDFTTLKEQAEELELEIKTEKTYLRTYRKSLDALSQLSLTSQQSSSKKQSISSDLSVSRDSAAMPPGHTDSFNIVFASLTFVVDLSIKGYELAKHFTVPIRMAGHRVFNVWESQDEGSVHYVVGSNGSVTPYSATFLERIRIERAPREISLGTFANDFHHSEQAVIEHLLAAGILEKYLINLVALLNRRELFDSTNGIKLPMMIVEMHSSRYMCSDCTYSLNYVVDHTLLNRLIDAVNYLAAFKNYATDYRPHVLARVTANYPHPETKGVRPSEFKKDPSTARVTLMEHRTDPISMHMLGSRKVYKQDVNDILQAGHFGKPNTLRSGIHRHSAAISKEVKRGDHVIPFARLITEHKKLAERRITEFFISHLRPGEQVEQKPAPDSPNNSS